MSGLSRSQRQSSLLPRCPTRSDVFCKTNDYVMARYAQLVSMSRRINEASWIQPRPPDRRKRDRPEYRLRRSRKQHPAQLRASRLSSSRKRAERTCFARAYNLLKIIWRHCGDRVPAELTHHHDLRTCCSANGRHASAGRLSMHRRTNPGLAGWIV